MANTMQTIASVAWLVLCVLVYIRLRQWNKKLGELYDELRRTIEEDS